MSAHRNRHAGIRATVVAGAVTAVTVLPVFLTGALAVQVTADLGFGPTGLGVGTAAFFVTQIATAPHLGRLCDRIGAIWSLRLAAAFAALACFGIATTADRLGVLVAWLVVGSFGNSLAQPAGNRLLVHRVRPARQGFAFGLKQSAPPVASMLAGLSVPFIALPFGWRVVFATAGLFAVVVFPFIGRRPVATHRTQRMSRRAAAMPRRSTVVILAAAFGFGLAVNSLAPVFYVHSAVTAGAGPQLAGTFLATGSATAIVVRVVAGLVCDRTVWQPLLICTWLLGTGTIGLLMLASGNVSVMGAGVIVTMAGTWGFNGVFWYALVTAFREVPGSITGAVSPGGFIGGTAGTAIFGMLADNASYPVAWMSFAVVGLFGVVVMRAADVRLRTDAPGPSG